MTKKKILIIIVTLLGLSLLFFVFVIKKSGERNSQVNSIELYYDSKDVDQKQSRSVIENKEKLSENDRLRNIVVSRLNQGLPKKKLLQINSLKYYLFKSSKVQFQEFTVYKDLRVVPRSIATQAGIEVEYGIDENLVLVKSEQIDSFVHGHWPVQKINSPVLYYLSGQVTVKLKSNESLPMISKGLKDLELFQSFSHINTHVFKFSNPDNLPIIKKFLDSQGYILSSNIDMIEAFNSAK